MAADARRHWSEDDALADEIELYGELVVAASESDSELTLPQIDRVLGVEADGDDEAPRSRDGAGEVVDVRDPAAAPHDVPQEQVTPR